MKKLFLIIPAILIVALLAFFFVWINVFTPVSAEKVDKSVLIVKGSTAERIANTLYEAGVIKSPFAFKLYAQVVGKANKIHAGEFRVSTNLSIPQILEVLLKGPIEVWVTVPEGLRREEVAGIFASGFELSSQKAEEFKNTFLDASRDMEGYLFPDTYLFPKDASASAVVVRMRSLFKSQVDFPVDADTVTLASILERETITDEEKPIVAGILLKRVRAGWAIQADATVQYAVGTPSEWWPILTREDLEVNSPFNSYKYQGLPPHPIASAGLSSIRASANPVESPYWYYIHDKDGIIRYATTLEEHNENVAKYLNK